MKPPATLLLALLTTPSTGLAAEQRSLVDRVEPAPVVLEGRVLTEGGLPAVGAVVVTSAGGQTATDRNGTFRLAVALSHGVQNVQVTAVANRDSVSQVGTTQVSELVPGGTTWIDTIVLQQSSGCQPSWLPTFGAAPGMNNGVSALTVFDDGSGPALYAGGFFTSAGGVSANRIAKWDGSSWSALAGGMNSTVFALTVFDDGSGGGPALIAGGNFTSAGGVPANRIAKWDGSSWSALGSGIDDSSVRTLTVFDDGSGGGPALYAGGNFTGAGGGPANYIAKWSGTSWSALGSGVNNNVFALTVFDDGGGPALFAGGGFTFAGSVSREARCEVGRLELVGSRERNEQAGLCAHGLRRRQWGRGLPSSPAVVSRPRAPFP